MSGEERVIPPYTPAEWNREETEHYLAERRDLAQEAVLRAREELLEAQIAVTTAKQKVAAAELFLERIDQVAELPAE